MRLSKQIIGIAVAVAFAFGLATTGTASALPNGTQVEFNIRTINDDTQEFREYVATVAFEFLWCEL